MPRRRPIARPPAPAPSPPDPPVPCHDCPALAEVGREALKTAARRERRAAAL